MIITNKEKDILNLALEQLEKYYKDLEDRCLEFKWICNKHLPQVGDGYIANKNVFEIQDKTVNDIRCQKAEARKFIMELIENGILKKN